MVWLLPWNESQFWKCALKCARKRKQAASFYCWTATTVIVSVYGWWVCKSADFRAQNTRRAHCVSPAINPPWLEWNPPMNRNPNRKHTNQQTMWNYALYDAYRFRVFSVSLITKSSDAEEEEGAAHNAYECFKWARLLAHSHWMSQDTQRRHKSALDRIDTFFLRIWKHIRSAKRPACCSIWVGVKQPWARMTKWS